MKILLTGATGYIGKRLLVVLLEQGHQVVCCVRDKSRLPTDGIYNHPNNLIFEADFLDKVSYNEILLDLDVAFYLIHSMSSNVGDFEKLETASANNFLELIGQTTTRQIIYLSGITNEKKLSRHLSSRRNVEDILKKGTVPVTILKAGIIVGSGSASFEIIRDLVEKLPLMIAPKWLNTKHQPVAVRNVIQCLTGAMMNLKTFNRSFDVGGPDILTYKEMLLQFAEVRGLKRIIISLPIMTPRLSSYWLYFVTATSYNLAVNLVNSMKIEIVARDNELIDLLKIKMLSYKESVQSAFEKMDQNMVVSSWKDALISSSAETTLVEHINVPVHGCFIDSREKEIFADVEQVVENIWSIGGKRGWYYADWLWRVRGFIDKLFGGVGLRRGRTNQNMVNVGDAIDFWRVLVADRKSKRLLLYAEMKLPGEAWLEFNIKEKNGKHYLSQIATFRPRGLWGRVYWYSILPFHHFIFEGMSDNIISSRPVVS